MIELPRRAVTRFFIPLIDVLILLFCIFLLMPFMSQPGNAESTDAQKALDKTKELTPEQMRRAIVDLQFDLERARKDIATLRGQKINPAKFVSTVILEADPKSRELVFYGDGKQLPIKGAEDLQAVVDDHTRIGTEPYVIVRLPRELAGFPGGRQLEDYRNWFKQLRRPVEHHFDDPLLPKPK